MPFDRVGGTAFEDVGNVIAQTKQLGDDGRATRNQRQQRLASCVVRVQKLGYLRLHRAEHENQKDLTTMARGRPFSELSAGTVLWCAEISLHKFDSVSVRTAIKNRILGQMQVWTRLALARLHQHSNICKEGLTTGLHDNIEVKCKYITKNTIDIKIYQHNSANNLEVLFPGFPELKSSPFMRLLFGMPVVCFIASGYRSCEMLLVID